MTQWSSPLSRTSAIATLLLTASVLVAPCASATAFATPSTAAAPALTAAAPGTAPSINVELWPGGGDQGTTTMIAVAEVPGSVKLPTTVRMPLPAGAQVTWAGQILGADISGDIPEKPRVVAARGGQFVELTASKSRIVQYEAVLGPAKIQGDAHDATLAWVQTTAASLVRFAVRLPIAATNVVIKPAPAGDPTRDDQLAQMLYPLAPVSLKPGATYTLSVNYNLAPGAGSPGAASDATGEGSAPAASSSAPGWVFAVLLVAVAVVPLVVMVIRRRSATSATADAEVAEDDADGVAPDEPADPGGDPEDGSR